LEAFKFLFISMQSFSQSRRVAGLVFNAKTGSGSGMDDETAVATSLRSGRRGRRRTANSQQGTPNFQVNCDGETAGVGRRISRGHWCRLPGATGRRTANAKSVAPRQVKAARARRITPNCYAAGVTLFHLPCFPW